MMRLRRASLLVAFYLLTSAVAVTAQQTPEAGVLRSLLAARSLKCSFNAYAVAERRRPRVAAPVAPHQPRPARDVARAMERGGVAAGQSRVQEGARAQKRDPTCGLVQLTGEPQSD
jgi:hypothetical protein